MKVIDEQLLEEFRRAGKCSWCGKPCPAGCHPHHLWARGMGGGGRLDVRVNLIALCPLCHTDVHAGNILRADLLAVVAVREGCLQGDVEAEIYRLRREPKRCPGNAGRRPK